jgi:hypothetical protein
METLVEKKYFDIMMFDYRIRGQDKRKYLFLFVQYSIVDLRIFSYFSNTQSLTANFLMSEISNSIFNNKIYIIKHILSNQFKFISLVIPTLFCGTPNISACQDYCKLLYKTDFH